MNLQLNRNCSRMKVHNHSRKKEGNIFIILNFEFKTINIFLKPMKNYFLLSRMILKVHLNVHEPSRRELLNDQNCNWSLSNDFKIIWKALFTFCFPTILIF